MARTLILLCLCVFACTAVVTSTAINLNRGGTCLTGSIGEFIITVDYIAGNGDEKTTTYSVPEAVSLSSNCVVDQGHGQEATIKLQFGRDVITLLFTASSNLIGKPIYLKRIEYNYVRDSRRFSLLLREDTQKMVSQFSDGDASFGVTGKLFKCTKMSLLLPNGIKFEMRNLQIGLFKTRDIFGEVTCAGASHRVTDAPMTQHHSRTTPRSPTGWGTTVRHGFGGPTEPAPTTFALPLRFGQEGCATGNAVVQINYPYVGRNQERRVAKYKIPHTATVAASCSQRSLRTKHAYLSFRWGEDVLNLEITAPAVSGNKLSLVNANYTVRQDQQRFPGAAEGATKMVSQTFSAGAVSVGQWHKFFSCPKFVVDFGSGVTAEFINLRLALFGTEPAAEVATCAAK